MTSEDLSTQRSKKKFYYNSSAIRYLNMNQRIAYKIVNLFKKIPKITSKKIYEETISDTLLKSFDSNIIFLYEESKVRDEIIAKYNDRFVLIKHKKKPFHFGFDTHWNINGRENCADVIIPEISKRCNLHKKTVTSLESRGD